MTHNPISTLNSDSVASDDSASLTSSDRFELAAKSRRLVAVTLDFIILTVLMRILATFLYFIVSDAGELSDAGKLIVLAMALIYEPYLIAAKGQTIGKIILDIKVVREDNGDLIGHGKSFIRFLVSIIPILNLIDALVLLFSPSKKSLHDMAVGTIVVKV